MIIRQIPIDIPPKSVVDNASSVNTIPIPPTAPPIIWLLAVQTDDLAESTATNFFTLTTPVADAHRPARKCAENEYIMNTLLSPLQQSWVSSASAIQLLQNACIVDRRQRPSAVPPAYSAFIELHRHAPPSRPTNKSASRLRRRRRERRVAQFERLIRPIPSVSAAIRVIEVPVPGPISLVALCIFTVPSGKCLIFSRRFAP